MKIANNSNCSLEDYHSVRETKEYRHMPLAFREYLGKDKRLTQTAKLVWITLSDYSVFHPEFKVQISLRVLGSKVGKDKRTASRALEELEKYGYIKTNLKNPEKCQESTIIWVRFPEDAVQTILQMPDRKVRREERKPEQAYSVNLVRNLDCEASKLSRPNDGIFAPERSTHAKSGASMSQGGAILPPINTNITNSTITKKTTNNIGIKQVSGNTPDSERELLQRLLDVECLFLKFVERANVLKSQNLETAEFKRALWEPFNKGEKEAITAFEAMKFETLGQTFDISTAIAVREKYNKIYTEAKRTGSTPHQAATIAGNALTSEENTQKNALQWATGRLAYILSPSADEKTAKKALQEKNGSVVVNIKPLAERIPIIQAQADKFVIARLQRAYQNGELKGEAAQADLQILAEQLMFHAEHWAPSNLQYKTHEERIKIAISVALKRMRMGNWSAPYGWIKQAILKREQENQQLKVLGRCS